MSTTELSQSAQENLRTIRALMERATIYRAISAGPALLGGLLAVGVAGYFFTRSEAVTKEQFVLTWLGALLVVDLFNTFLLYREARQRGASFPSSSTLHGIKALAPAMGACGIIGLVFAWGDGGLVRGVLLWVVGYGLGLLATASFAPRSIRALGWGFLFAGLGWFLLGEWRSAETIDQVKEASRIMAVTFGGFHLVYAVRTGWWKRESDS